jgi:hypothetical protein
VNPAIIDFNPVSVRTAWDARAADVEAVVDVVADRPSPESARPGGGVHSPP